MDAEDHIDHQADLRHEDHLIDRHDAEAADGRA